MSLLVESGGRMSLVMDLGRRGTSVWGVPCGGAMDAWSLDLANRLVGNDPSAAGLEFVDPGPTLVATKELVVALTGSRFETDLDGVAAPFERPFRFPASATLRVGRALDGARGYLAVRGGIAAPVILGSRSPIPRAHEPMLRPGMELPVGREERNPVPRRVPTPVAARAPRRVVRAVPESEAPLGSAAACALLESEYIVTPSSSRIAIVLAGPPLPAGGATDVLPTGTIYGTIQVPGDGVPVIIGPDGPATGGYAQVATVAAVDLPVLAHLTPGDVLRFASVTVEEARAAWREASRARAQEHDSVPPEKPS